MDTWIILIKFSININKINFLQLGEKIEPFTITMVLHSYETFVRGKITISWKNRDIKLFSMTSFYHSQMFQMNAGQQLS